MSLRYKKNKLFPKLRTLLIKNFIEQIICLAFGFFLLPEELKFKKKNST